MNICLFTPSFLPRVGGLEYAIDQLARQYLAMDHQPVVLAKTPREFSADELHKFAASAPYPVVWYPRSRSQTWLLGSTKRALLAEHAARKFDIVNAHQTYPAGHVAVSLRARLGVPVVITSQRGDIGVASRYRHRWVTSRRMARALRLADACTGVSAELTQIMSELTGGQARTCIIGNGVDLDIRPPDSPPAQFADLAGRPFMLTLGRLHPYKGLDLLLAAIAMLRDRGGTVPHLVVAGDGKIMDDLKAQAAESGISDRVSFAGSVFGDTKNWLLANCQFFVQPSREEGMPLTVLEAMGAGRPIIGSDLPGISQIVGHEKSGLLFHVNDADGLADAVARMSSDASLRDRLSAGARVAAQPYAWPAVARQYLTLFESLM